MRDICDKRPSLRRAKAKAIVRMQPETAARIKAGTVPKGSVAEFSRAAAMLGAKKTPDLLPFCHRIPLDFCDATLEVSEADVAVVVEVGAIARTGVEVEAMTAAAIAALNVYDMVKPIDSSAHIGAVQLLDKQGGKSAWRQTQSGALKAGVVVVSDSVFAGTKEDSAGQAVLASLEHHGLETTGAIVVPDDPERLRAAVLEHLEQQHCQLVFAVGGTGLGPRDRTPEALEPLFDRPVPGVAEAIRAFGRERTPLSDLSRCVAGQRGDALIIGTPGSRKAASEAMDALMPWLLHAFDVFDASFRHGQ